MPIQPGQTNAAADVLRGQTADGYIRFDELIAATNKTISAGDLTVTSNLVNVSNEGGAATDDLETITASSPLVLDDGLILILRPSGSFIFETVIKHNTSGAGGKINCPNGRDIIMRNGTVSGGPDVKDAVVLMRLLGSWYVIFSTSIEPEQNLFNYSNFN